MNLSSTDSSIVVHHGLVIIRGIFQDNSALQINNKKNLNHESPVILNCFNGRFVGLARLSPGENTLTFEDGSKFGSIIYNPSECNFRVRGLLVLCSSDPLEDEEALLRPLMKKVHFALELVQAIFSDELEECGLGRRTFTLSHDDEILRIPHSKGELEELTNEEAWEVIGKALQRNQSLWNEDVKHVAIINSDPNGKDRAGLGIGGLAVLWTKSIENWPQNMEEFQNMLKGKEPQLIGEWLGGLCHELCHLFDLGHSTKGLMGKDYPDIRLLFFPRASSSSSSSHLTKRCKSVFEDAQESYFNHKVIAESAKSQIPDVSEEEYCILSLSDASLLYFHRWFSPELLRENSDYYPPTLDRRGTIHAPFGLVVVEIRAPDGLVTKSWVFSQSSVPITEFTLRRSDFFKCQNGPQVVIQDLRQISKITVDPASFPQRFTLVKRPTNFRN